MGARPLRLLKATAVCLTVDGTGLELIVIEWGQPLAEWRQRRDPAPTPCASQQRLQDRARPADGSGEALAPVRDDGPPTEAEMDRVKECGSI
jgi:hypothetical protein